MASYLKSFTSDKVTLSEKKDATIYENAVKYKREHFDSLKSLSSHVLEHEPPHFFSFWLIVVTHHLLLVTSSWGELLPPSEILREQSIKRADWF